MWECKHLFNPLQPGESCGQRSLVGCCLWGHTESDMPEVTQQQLQTSFESLFLFPLDKYLEEKLLDHIVALFLIFEECSQYFPQWLHQFTFLLIVHKGSFFSISSQTLVISYLFDNSHSNIFLIIGVRSYLTVVLICISLIISDFEHLLIFFGKNFNLLDFVISTLYNKKPEVQRNDVFA